MTAYLQLILVAALPVLTGVQVAVGEVVSVVETPEFLGEPSPLVLAVGSAAELDCRVIHLGDKSVSWVRSRDLHILSHAGAVFTADPRVSVAVSGPGSGAGSGAGIGAGGVTRQSLRIDKLRVTDGGRYECQVNTEPKMSQFFNLTVVDELVPETVVSVVGERQVMAATGGAATLVCEARYQPPPRELPLPTLDIHWFFGDQPIDLQSERGGVSLDMERWTWRCVSRLTLATLAPRDAGLYRCVAGDVADTLRLRVADYTEGALMEAMQRDQSAMSFNGGASITLTSSLIVVLMLILLQR